jgi:hypothetical protein
MAKDKKRRFNKKLKPKELITKISKTLVPLDKLSFLEQYGMFMGKVQLVEFVLKKLLRNKYHYTEKKTEKFTLGASIVELKKLGLRKDFIFLLEQLNEYRIQIAHYLLADDAIGKSLIGEKFEHLSMKTLNYGLIKVEEVIQVYDFLSANKYL